jgi:hypothetical protein
MQTKAWKMPFGGIIAAYVLATAVSICIFKFAFRSSAGGGLISAVVWAMLFFGSANLITPNSLEPLCVATFCPAVSYAHVVTAAQISDQKWAHSLIFFSAIGSVPILLAVIAVEVWTARWIQIVAFVLGLLALIATACVIYDARKKLADKLDLPHDQCGVLYSCCFPSCALAQMDAHMGLTSGNDYPGTTPKRAKITCGSSYCLLFCT